MNEDKKFMQMALARASRALGQVAPNPAVGCVLVKNGAVIAAAHTAKTGRPHAETQALAAGKNAAGATAYVTLEPCAHQGHTGPCANALIDAGVARVVVAIEDPDARVSGKGIALLQKANLQVDVGVLAQEAAILNAGFLKRIRTGRPVFTLKLATSLDGRIATAKGESKWITGDIARAYAHKLRSTHDAIMIGIGTALADNPMLDCRLQGLEGASPIRIVVDRKLKLPLNSQLITTAQNKPLWIVTDEKADAKKCAALEACGVKIIRVPITQEGYVDLGFTARKLGDLGLTRIVVEGGAQLAAALLRHDLVDQLEWLTAPFALGGDGVPALQSLTIEKLSQFQRYTRLSSRVLGEDRLDCFSRIS